MAETLTQKGLAGLAAQMPVRNQAIADQQRAARLLQLQQAVSQLPTGAAPTAQQAAGMGTALAQQSGAEQVSRTQQMVQQSAQLGQLGQQEQQLVGQQQLAAAQQAGQKESLDQASRLAALDANAKKELFDNQLQFKKDEANRTLFNERQLADYKAMTASRAEDFKNWSQRSQQMHDRNVQVLQTVSAKLSEAIQQQYALGKQKQDQALTQELVQLKRDNDIRLAKAQANAANTASMWGALGSAAMVAGGAAITATGLGAPVGVPLIAAGAGASYYGQQEAAKKGSNI